LEASDHEIPYLKQILGFIGISDVTFIQAGGTSGIAQGKISEAEFLLPFLEKARAAIQYRPRGQN
jgi:FMN-dependent NADH-azoreductase